MSRIHAAATLLTNIENGRKVPAAKRFQILTYEELSTLPPPEPLLTGILFQGSLAVLVGLRSSFKSFLALDWSLCVATGRPWLGRKVHPGWVVYICAEGAWGMRKRVAAWLQANEWSGELRIRFVPQKVRITEPLDVAAILAQIGETKPAPVLIVIDTVARNFVGNENAAEDMQRFVNGCDMLRETTGGACVLAVHHMGWEATRSRGSTVLPDAADTEILATRDGDRVTLKNSKQKDDREADEIRLDTYPVGDSLVLKRVGIDDVTPTVNETRSLKALQSAGGMDGASSGEWKDMTGLPPSSYYHAVKSLTENGWVEKRRNKYHLTERGRTWITPNSNDAPTSSPKPGPVQLQHSNGIYSHGVLENGVESRA